MPIIVGLEILAQIFCAVHVVRTGRPYYWIYIIIGIPTLGVLIYLFAEVLPDASRTRTARRAAAGVVKAIDPERGVREALRRVEMTPTVANKVALAGEYFAAGKPEEAAALYRETLEGIHATDPQLMTGLARALHAIGSFAEAEAVLDAMHKANPDHPSSEAHLLYALCLEAQGKDVEALEEFAALQRYYPGQEARWRYGALLERSGRVAEARSVYQEICKGIEYGPRHQYREQRQWYDLARQRLQELPQA